MLWQFDWTAAQMAVKQSKFVWTTGQAKSGHIPLFKSWSTAQAANEDSAHTGNSIFVAKSTCSFQ